MRTLLAILALALLLLAPVPAGAEAPSLQALREAALPRALAYLALQPPSEYVAEAVLGAGLDPGLWPTPATNLLDRIHVPAVGTAGNDPIREIHAIAQSGYDPYRFRGRDLVADLKAAWPASNQGVGQHAFTILGLHAAGVQRGDPLLEEAVTKLQQAQYPDGGWACTGFTSPDCTGFALVALASVDAFLPKMAERAKAWLDNARLPDGGYGSLGASPTGLLLSLSEGLGVTVPVPDPWCSLSAVELPTCQGEANTDSTIWAINGYRALGFPAPEESWRFILDLQQPDGSFAWKAAGEPPITRTFATAEVVAGWLRSFHDLPRHAPATVRTDAAVVGSSPFRLEGAPVQEVAWTVLDPPQPTVGGNPANLRLAPGTATVHVEGRGPGIHHRERFTVEVGNALPRLLGLPAELVAPRAAAIGLQPRAVDPEGGEVAVAWTFGPESGTGAVTAVPHELGLFPLRLRATDPHGAVAEATVTVRVVNAPPVLLSLRLPGTAVAGPVGFAADAADPDGGPPALAWDFCGSLASGGSGSVLLAPGECDVVLTVQDADGATLAVRRSLLVVPAAPATVPPAFPAGAPAASPPSGLDAATPDGQAPADTAASGAHGAVAATGQAGADAPVLPPGAAAAGALALGVLGGAVAVAWPIWRRIRAGPARRAPAGTESPSSPAP